jgi:hypothetical protein
MWIAEQMEGEVVGKLPTYAPAFKEVYRFILKALDGDVFAATDLFQKYLAGEMPERPLYPNQPSSNESPAPPRACIADGISLGEAFRI